MNSFITPYINLFSKKGYSWFDSNKPYNLNIFSIRNPNGKVNAFDDALYCIYRKENLEWMIKQYTVTTDPGTSSLQSPTNSKGTAILAPGQYLGVYKVDLHKGKYEALCQRNGTVKVYRDNNRDATHNLDPETLDTGWFGINIHKAGEDSTYVDGWSAGCTVFKRARDFSDFMAVVNKAKRIYGNSFTYTLFDGKELV